MATHSLTPDTWHPAPPACPHCRTRLAQPVEIIPVGVAVLCGNCDCVTATTNGHCLACGSKAVVNLEKLLSHRAIETSSD